MDTVSTWLLASGLGTTVVLATLARYQVSWAWRVFVIMVVVDMLLYAVYRLAHGKEG